MNGSLEHLDPDVREVATLPASERRSRMGGRTFMENPQAHRVLSLLTDRRNLSVLTQPHLLVWGTTGMGKTTIISRYGRENQPVFNKQAGVRSTPVVFIEFPPLAGDVNWLFQSLLEAINAPIKKSGRPGEIAQRIVGLYRICGVRQVVIDEIHNSLGGSVRQQRDMLNTIRWLSNMTEISLACFGTEDAREAFVADDQLYRRFKVAELPPWVMDDDYSALIGSILRRLPLRNKSLITASFLRELLSKAEGNTNWIFHHMNGLGLAAIDSGGEMITPELAKRYFRDTIP